MHRFFVSVLASALCLHAFPVTRETKWMQVSPTNTLGQVIDDLNLATNSVSPGPGPSPSGGGSNVGLTNSVLYVDGQQTNLVTQQGNYGVALGMDYGNNGAGTLSFAAGMNAKATNSLSFVWSSDIAKDYGSKGDNTFSVNPVAGPYGFYIGSSNLVEYIHAFAPPEDLSPYLTTNEADEVYATKQSLSSYLTINEAAAEYATKQELSQGLDDILNTVDVDTNVVIAISNNVLSVTTNGVVLWASSEASVGRKRIAMFIVPINCGDTGFAGFELKASTNNFDISATPDQRLQFYAQSELADTGGTVAGDTLDRMRLFICSNHQKQELGPHDNRSYVCISNTANPSLSGSAFWPDGYPYQYSSIVALVDTSCLVRNPETGESVWLESENEDLTWRYLKDRNNAPPEQEDGVEWSGSHPMWRPIEPARWFSKMPKWAR